MNSASPNDHSVSLLDHDLNRYFPELLKFNSIEETERSAVYQKIRTDVERILGAVVCENFADESENASAEHVSAVAWNIERGCIFEGILDALKNHSRIQPGRVIIDHVEEHTAPLVLEQGYWAGITLYPESKATPHRAIDMFELYGHDRLWLNSACDWGHSDPLAVPRTGLELRRRGYDSDFIDKVLYRNPLEFLSQNPRFQPLA